VEKNIIMGEIDITNLLKAFNTFRKFILSLNTEQEKAGAIQAFEFSYELAWKTMKKVLFKNGLATSSPRDTFRVAAMNNLIDNPETWFEFLKKRNLTVHTYDEEVVNQIIKVFPTFEKELAEFIERVKAL
jgi:nucleotidyltransferase substrate binding protein (TIGR01987 family)